jgi:hypothetical protein
MTWRPFFSFHAVGGIAAGLLLCGGVNGMAQMRGDPGTYQRPIIGGPLTADDVFNPAENATAAIDAAIARAQARGRHTMIIFGGAWCHDSRALVDLFQTERFEYMLWPRYELVYVHMPMARGERDHPLAHRFGLGDIVGTPTVLILGPDGEPTNLTDAPRWRNAASRKPDAIFRQLRRAAPAIEGP